MEYLLILTFSYLVPIAIIATVLFLFVFISALIIGLVVAFGKYKEEQ